MRRSGAVLETARFVGYTGGVWLTLGALPRERRIMTTAVEKERVVYARGRDRDFTEEEYDQLQEEANAARERGDIEEFDRLMTILPVPPRILKAFAVGFGRDFIIESGYDLTEANLEFGEGWLDKIWH